MEWLFGKESKKKKLHKKYQKLMKESHKLSQSNRLQGDKKFAEAQVVLEELEALED